MPKTVAQLIAQAEIIRNETQASGNTAARVADTLEDMITSLQALETSPDQVSVDTSGSTVTLDIASKTGRTFLGSANIGANKIIAVNNATIAQQLQFVFNLTTLAILTLPSNFKLSDAGWDNTLHQWTPFDIGLYKMRGIYDNVNTRWIIEIEGPFS